MAQTPATRYTSEDEKLDYTPSSAITGGDVNVINGLTTIAEIDIASGKQGAIVYCGQFEVPKDTSTFSLGDPVYWNASGSPVTGTASSGAATSTIGANTLMGFAMADAATGDSQVACNVQPTIPSARFFIMPEAIGTAAVTHSTLVVPRKMKLSSVNYVHATGSTSGTLQVAKCTGTQAPGSGTNLLTGTIDMSATTVANTVTAGTLIATAATLTFAQGDRVAIVIAGTLTSLVGASVTMTFQYV